MLYCVGKNCPFNSVRGVLMKVYFEPQEVASESKVTMAGSYYFVPKTSKF